MKILFVSPEIPYPLDTGGKIRSFNILKELSKKAQIILLGFAPSARDKFWALSLYTKKIIALPLSIHMQKKILNLFLSWVSPYPMRVLNFHSSIMERKIKEVISHEAPDIVYFEHIYMGAYIKNLDSKLKGYFTIIDTHNVYFQLFASLAQSRNKLKAVINKTQIKKMQRFEIETYSLFDLVLVCSSREKNLLAKYLCPTKIKVVPNGVDLSLYQGLQKIKDKGNSILFVGSFDHFPNQEGALWFIEEVFPPLEKKIKGLTFYLIGRRPPLKILKFKKNPHIKILGYVNDLKPYYSQAKVFVAPLFSGGGTRLKILDAMAARIPVVATPLAAEGLEVKDGENILLARSSSEFAQKVIELINDEALSQKICQNAYQLLKERYQWSVCVKPLIKSILS